MWHLGNKEILWTNFLCIEYQFIIKFVKELHGKLSTL
jgi:hypothetical protein